MSETPKGKYDKFPFDTDFFEIAIQEQEARQVQAAAGAGTPHDPVAAEEAGYAKGLMEGQKQAAQSMQKDLHQHVIQVSEKLDKIDQTKAEYAAILEAKALTFMRQLLKKVVAHAHTHYSDEMLQSAIKQALERITSDTHLKVRVNPATKQFLEGSGQDLIKDHNTTLISDHHTQPGDCILEWDTGGVDARLDLLVKEVDQLIESGIAGAKAPVVNKAPHISSDEAAAALEKVAGALPQSDVPTTNDGPTPPSLEETDAVQNEQLEATSTPAATGEETSDTNDTGQDGTLETPSENENEKAKGNTSQEHISLTPRRPTKQAVGRIIRPPEQP